MMVYDRAAQASAHDASYRLILCAPGCVYCGLASKTLDHVPPLRFVHVAGADRFLYPACHVCNLTLGPLPDVCLRKRSAFLIASLRAEWRQMKRGNGQRWLLKAVEARGRAVRDRLQSGDIARVCQCVRCSSESTGLAANPHLGERCSGATAS